MTQKPLTPMKRYRETLKTLTKCLERSFTIHQFTKSKTITEDCIIVFYPKPAYRDKEYRSFAITFDYLNKTPDEQRVIFSIKPMNDEALSPNIWDGEWKKYEKREARLKLNESIVYSDRMPLKAFNARLKQWVDVLKMMTATNAALTPDVVIDMADREFFDSKQTLTEQVQALTAELVNTLAPTKKAFDTAQARLHSTADEIKSTKKAIDRSAVRTKEYRRVNALEQELAQAKADLQTRLEKIEKEQCLSEKKRTNREADRQYHRNKKDMNDAINNAVAPLQAGLRGNLKTALIEALGIPRKDLL